MSSKFWAELSSDYEKLFETEIGYDVIIYAGEEENSKEIHAHSNILSIRSQYFRTAFSNEWAEKKDGKFVFRKPNTLLKFRVHSRCQINVDSMLIQCHHDV